MKHKGIILLFFLVIYCSLFPVCSNADSLDSWYPRSSPVQVDLRGVTYGKVSFVAVGDSGVILTSPDGIAWATMTSGTQNQLNAVAYGNDLFIAVGNDGTILTSPDGIIWDSASSGISSQFSGVTFGNGEFVVVGDSGTILTSPDGVHWTSRSSGTYEQLFGITYGNGIFVAVGSGSYRSEGVPEGMPTTILTSPDGIHWTSRSSGWIGEPLRAVAYGDNGFMAVGGTVLTSSDGTAWVENFPSGEIGIGLSPLGVAYGGDRFVVIASGSSFMLPAYEILTFSGSSGWSAKTFGGNTILDGITYGNGTFVTVGSNGTILQSESVCSATLDSQLSIHIPYLVYDSMPYWADFTYVTNTLDFKLVNYGNVTDAAAFEGCTPAILSNSLLLHIPNLMFNGTSYWLDLQFMGEGTTFTYSNAGTNE